MGLANSNSAAAPGDWSAWSRWLGWRKRPTPMPGRVNAEGRPQLESVLGHPDFRIPCDRLIKASGSIVYAWMRQGRALYVGMSGHGLLRPLSASHDVCWAFEPGDFLYVWKMASRQEAHRHERRAILSMGPEFNLPGADRPQRGAAEALVEEGTAPTEPAATQDERVEPENLSFPW